MRRPAILTVLGVLSLLYAAFALCGDLWTAVRLAAPGPEPGARAGLVPLAFLVFSFATTAALAAGGIGLLRCRAWGRTLSLAYAFATIVAVIVGLAIQYVQSFGPALKRAAEVSPQLHRLVATNVTAAVCMALVGLIYPAVLIILLARRKAMQEPEAEDPSEPSEIVPVRLQARSRKAA